MPITEEIVKTCPEVLKSELVNLKKADEIYEHSGRVCNICIEIYNKLHFKEDVNYHLLCTSAWLHDIGKAVKKKSHHKKAIKVISKHKNELQLNKFDIQQLHIIIKCHKGKFQPDRGVFYEAAILRMADKIDKMEQAYETYNKSKCEIIKYSNEHNVACLFESCDKILEEYILNS